MSIGLSLPTSWPMGAPAKDGTNFKIWQAFRPLEMASERSGNNFPEIKEATKIVVKGKFTSHDFCED